MSPVEWALQGQSVSVEHDPEDPAFARESVFDATAGPITIPQVLERLDLDGPMPVLVIIGGADQMSNDIGKKVRALFERSLVPVLRLSDTIVITGGTQSGVMAIAGETLSAAAKKLVGVTPSGPLANHGSVSLQTDHDLNVLTAGSDWGSETDYMVQLATAITQGARCGVVVLINGGSIAFEEIDYFVEAGWPVLALAGSGRLADDLVTFSNEKRFTRKRRRAEYDWKKLKNADLASVSIDASPGEVRKRFHWYISQDELLKSAWTYFVAFDQRANHQQRSNLWIRISLQALSLAILSLVLLQFEASFPLEGGPPGMGPALQFLKAVTVPVAVALPIALAIAAAISQSVAADRGWRVLRGAAEAMKREIYRYRAGLVRFSGDESSLQTARRELERTIDSALSHSSGSGFLLSVNLSSRRGRPADLDEGDDELAQLSVASYTSHRIEGQISYFQASGRKLRKRARRVVIGAALLAGLSGYLASTYFAPWAAMAVLGVTALAAYLERSRLTDRADRYATTSAELAQIKTSLSVEGRASQGQTLVLHSTVLRTESALEGESLAWEQLVWKDVREARQSRPEASGPDSAGPSIE